MQDYYMFNLKNKATKNFLKWCNKKVKLSPEEEALNNMDETSPKIGYKSNFDKKRSYAFQLVQINKEISRVSYLIEENDNKLNQIEAEIQEIEFEKEDHDTEDREGLVEEMHRLKGEREEIFKSNEFEEKKINMLNEQLKDIQIKEKAITAIKDGQKGGGEQTKAESPYKKVDVQKDLDRFIKDKKVKLMSKDNKNMLNPLMEVYDLLILQDLDLRIREINGIKLRSRGKNKRAGRKTQK